ncbi:hypothetical protein FGIG_07661 [Fasciola gigantica]|uniref:Uncharacterized protein n=1 Tax=Fasciola gigantica TaxID=46835 RepID=A0A504YVK2_FASGI|nr:hypothetical protein FGIG_07661 [Fasciola gigantica]
MLVGNFTVWSTESRQTGGHRMTCRKTTHSQLFSAQPALVSMFHVRCLWIWSPPWLMKSEPVAIVNCFTRNR